MRFKFLRPPEASFALQFHFLYTFIKFHKNNFSRNFSLFNSFSFKNGTINCIVATDVVDEGIDVPSCTLVVRYYAPQDFRAYVQSKGRARHSTSKFVILAEKGSPYIGQHQSFKQTERILQVIIFLTIFKKVYEKLELLFF